MSIHLTTITITRDVHVPVSVYDDRQDDCAARHGKTHDGDRITLTDEERQDAVDSLQEPQED